jgi:hypothetical protein
MAEHIGPTEYDDVRAALTGAIGRLAQRDGSQPAEIR